MPMIQKFIGAPPKEHDIWTFIWPHPGGSMGEGKACKIEIVEGSDQEPTPILSEYLRGWPNSL